MGSFSSTFSAGLALICLPVSEGIIGWKLELAEVEPNNGEPNAGVRRADVQEDSLGGGLELNDDKRLSTSITSVSVNLLSDLSLRTLTVLSNDCSDDFISCSCRDCASLISFNSLAIKGGIPTPCCEEGNLCVCVCKQNNICKCKYYYR